MNLFSNDNKRAASLAILLALAMVVSIFAGSALALIEPEPVKRLAGDDRYETSAEVALDYHRSKLSPRIEEPSGNIIIARGDKDGDWADGLAGGYLSRQLGSSRIGAPILLTKPDELPKVIADAIEEINPEKAYILGGPVAISEAVENELKEMLDGNVDRIYGNNREETAVEIAKFEREEPIEPVLQGESTELPDAFIVNGRAPADAMAAGAAARYGVPILLVGRDSVPEVTIDQIKDNYANLVIVGGPAVVSEGVKDELEAIEGVIKVDRVAGKDREETSVELAIFMLKNGFRGFMSLALLENEISEERIGSHYYTIVNGRNGLADAVGAAVTGFPILYVNSDSIPDVVNDFFGEVFTPSQFVILGGTAVVRDDVAGELQEIIETIVVKDESELSAALKFPMVKTINLEGDFLVIKNDDDSYWVFGKEKTVYGDIEVSGDNNTLRNFTIVGDLDITGNDNYVDNVNVESNSPGGNVTITGNLNYLNTVVITGDLNITSTACCNKVDNTSIGGDFVDDGSDTNVFENTTY